MDSITMCLADATI